MLCLRAEAHARYPIRVNLEATHRTIHSVFRKESPRLIASLARIVGDVGRAEELAQDALLGALESWPETGVPDNARAWLMATAKHRAFDELRRRKRHQQGQGSLEYQLDMQTRSFEPDTDDIADDMLRLVFTACHPVLSADARVALTLRLLAGLTVEEIARAYLCLESTVAQRIARAKRTLSDKQVPFEVPGPSERGERLSSVLEVLYLIFNEGYAATAGDHWMRPALCEEALRLAHVLAELSPHEPEVWALLALMELHGARAAARGDAQGDPVSLSVQDRSAWNQLALQRGLAALQQVTKLGGDEGTFALQAAIVACHARASSVEDTDWPRIVSLYEALLQHAPSPVFALNGAVAVSMVDGPTAGLMLVDKLRNEPLLTSYYLLPAVRGDLLYKLCRFDEARQEFERAASLTRNLREQASLYRRAEECGPR